MDNGGDEALQRWLEDHPDARLVVVDILKKVRPRTSGNRSVYDADYEALESMQPLAARYGVAILVVHHLRKQGAEDPLDEISGSTGLSGGADGVLVLKRDRGGGDAYLHVDGRDIEEPAELALTWNANTCGWTLAEDAEQYRLSKSRAKIIEVLEEAGEPMRPTEVADALGKSVNTIKQRLWHMSKEGQLLASDGRYSLPKDHNPRNPHNRNLEKPHTLALESVTQSVTQEEQEHNRERNRERALANGKNPATVTAVTRVTDVCMCKHDYPGGKGCYLCDPEHPYRKQEEEGKA